MKITELSSDIPTFRTVVPNRDFSIILGVAKSKGEGKSHNLGKTTLVELIDHILFGSRDSERIKSIKANFSTPVFYISLDSNGTKETIKVDYNQKKRKPTFSKEKRQQYEYFIRFQDDYKDEFRKVTVRGKDGTWKPLLLRLMGFDEKPLIEKYEIEATISDYDRFIEIASESGMQRQSKQHEIDALEQRMVEIEESIDDLNFSTIEEATSNELAEKIDIAILEIKKELFSLKREFGAVSNSLKKATFVDLSPERIAAIYTELEIYFSPRLTKDLRDVEEFFSQITANRTAALASRKKRLQDRIDELTQDLQSLSKKRADYMRLMLSTNAIEVYKELSVQLAQTSSEISLLKQDIYRESIQVATGERNFLRTKQLELAAAVAKEIDENDELFSFIQTEYSSIMKEVMDIEAELMIEKNSTGNITFKTESWKDGAPSQELKGEMAKRISCAAFDVALRIANNSDGGFIIHDGVVDNADMNVKEKFIHAMKSRAIDHNFQYIMTAISDELPKSVGPEDIVITLSDKNEASLLMGKSF